jgi:hypothetical protein
MASHPLLNTFLEPFKTPHGEVSMEEENEAMTRRYRREQLVHAALMSRAYNRPGANGVVTGNLKADVEILEKFIEEAGKCE